MTETQPTGTTRRYSPCRFEQGGKGTAYLDEEGQLYLRDEHGNLEVFRLWKDFVRVVMQCKPVSDAGPEEDIVEQLSISLGPAHAINKEEENNMPRGVYDRSRLKRRKRALVAAEKAEPAPFKSAIGQGKPTKKEKKAAKAASRRVASRVIKEAKAIAVEGDFRKIGPDGLPLCLCGCERPVLNRNRFFLQGHDSRFHSVVRKIEKGEAQISDLPAEAQQYYTLTFGEDGRCPPPARPNRS